MIPSSGAAPESWSGAAPVLVVFLLMSPLALPAPVLARLFWNCKLHALRRIFPRVFGSATDAPEAGPSVVTSRVSRRPSPRSWPWLLELGARCSSRTRFTVRVSCPLSFYCARIYVPFVLLRASMDALALARKYNTPAYFRGAHPCTWHFTFWPR